MGNEVKLDRFGHIAIIVKDVEAATKAWSSLLGIGPWKIMDGGPVKLAHATLGSVQFELTEPVEEKTLWADFLNTHGEGLHHICFFVADLDDAVAKLVAEGGEVTLSNPGLAYVKTGGPGSALLELIKTRSPG